jgi:hypothetical protein
MSRRAIDLANVLLRLGVLDRDDPEQAALREELFGDDSLYEDVNRRLKAVGYELVQMLGHVGVRLERSSAIDPLVTARNNLGLDARHVRVLVYLWVQLLYRHLKATLRAENDEPRGRTQTLLGLDEPDVVDEAPSLPGAELQSEFAELTSKTALKGALTRLKRLRFVTEEHGVLRAGPAMYVLIDHERMEEHVVGLARRGVLALPEDP